MSNNRTLRPASGVRHETKPLLREPNNYIKRTCPLFSSFRVVRPTQFFGIIKNKKKNKKKTRKQEKRNGKVEPLINSFNFKYEHYNNISRHKRFGGVSFLLWNRPSYFQPYSVCFDLVTMSRTISCLACAGGWKWWAQERTGRPIETRVSPLAPVPYRAVLRSACDTGVCLVVFKVHHRNPRSYL